MRRRVAVDPQRQEPQTDTLPAPGLPHSFLDLGERLGFTAQQLKLRYGDSKGEHDQFMAAFGKSLLYCAEREPGFYENARMRRANGYR